MKSQQNNLINQHKNKLNNNYKLITMDIIHVYVSNDAHLYYILTTSRRATQFACQVPFVPQ